MKFNIIVLFIVANVCFSCKPDLSNSKVESLYKEVMIIHDEVMPEISTIHKLKKSIKKAEKLGDEELDIILRLDEADESMMQWMSDFGAFRKMDDKSTEERLKYLELEKVKISDVSKQMKTVIKEAQTYLETK